MPRLKAVFSRRHVKKAEKGVWIYKKTKQNKRMEEIHGEDQNEKLDPLVSRERGFNTD